METTTLLAFLLAAAAAAAQAQAPPPPVAATKAEQWALVRRVNSAAAYETYLRRFPAGRHAERARRALRRLGGTGDVPALPPANPPPAPPSSEQAPCAALLAENPAPAQALAYHAARRDNRLADLRLYVAAYPQGPCTPNIARVIEARGARRAAIVRIPGLGPLPPHPRTREVFTNDDYPAAAIRAEHMGAAVAVWEVAEDGVPEGCRIAGSSGSHALDRATCAIILRRMTYDPARGAAGNPVRSTDSMRVRWVLPDDPPDLPDLPQVPKKQPAG